MIVNCSEVGGFAIKNEIATGQSVHISIEQYHL